MQRHAAHFANTPVHIHVNLRDSESRQAYTELTGVKDEVIWYCLQ
jgi:hypothetical protein